MDNEKYAIDIITLEELDIKLYQKLIIDYIGINKSSYDQGDSWEYDFDQGDMTSLSDIPGEFIVSYINTLYPDNITIGTTFEEFESGNVFVIKINNEIRNDIIDVYPDTQEYI